MAHIRTQIRNKVATNLNNLTFESRVLPIYYDNPIAIQPKNIPCLSINTQGEDIEDATIGYPAVQNKKLQLNISIIQKSTENMQDDLDDILVLVEKAMSDTKAKKTLDGLVKNIKYKSSNNDTDFEQEKPLGIFTLTYEVWYMNVESNPEVSY